MPLGTNAMWGVVLPVEKTNYVTNPSYERGSAGAAANVGATLSLSSSRQARGVFSLQVLTGANGTSGAYVGSFTPPTGGEGYSISADLSLPANSRWRFGIERTDTGAQQYGTVIGGGTWQRIGSSFTIASVVNHRILVFKDTDTTTYSFNADGVQAEVGSVTTYIDGDQEGCMWQGAPHASSSLRSGQSRAGGSVVALADLGFRVDDAQGIGMAPLETSSQSYALLPGAEFQSQRAEVRPFVLSTQMGGTTWRDFHNTRRTVIDALKIDAVAEQQPIRFWYVGGEGTMQIDAVLDAGMEGGNKSGFTESYGVRFLAHDPYWETTTDQGTVLVGRSSIGSANFIVQRDPLGRWGTMGIGGTTFTGVSGGAFGGVRTILVNDGTVFAGGSWGSVAGTAGLNIAMFSRTAGVWGTLAGGAVGLTVRDLAMAPFGSLYVAGEFTAAAGTRAVGIAQWNGAWGTLTGGTLTDNAWALRLTPSGTLFVGGEFLAAGGTQAPLIARWVNGVWGTLTGGTLNNNVVREIGLGLDGRIYAGGNFTTAAGTTTNRIAVWDGAWGTLSYGADADIYQIVTMPDARLVATGLFGSIGSVGAPVVGLWNGLQWTALGGGLQSTSGAGSQGRAAIADPQTGDLYVGGVFNRANGKAVPDSVAHWNGYTWLPLDIDLNQQGTIHALALAPDKTLYMGGTFSGTAQAANVAMIFNTGMAESYPIIRFRNAGANTPIYQLINTLTGDAIYFDYTMQTGEEIALTLMPGSRTMTSSFAGNIFRSILSGSNLASWRLLPGTNWVSFFAGSGSVTAALYYRARSWSADGTVV